MRAGLRVFSALMRNAAVWIDLENSPHVPFFLPWMTRLEREGYTVALTARDLSQTRELLRLHGRDYASIGDHGGGSAWTKARRTVARSLALARWARGSGAALALGHGSRAQCLAAFLAGVPSLTFVDYEFVALRLFGLLAREVYVPDAVSPTVLRRQGVPRRKLVLYTGFKEQVYLDAAVDLRAPVDPPLILVRPPARLAHYHAQASDRLYERLVSRLLAEARDCRVLFLPRYESDRPALEELGAHHEHVEIAREAEDGRALLKAASLVVSGGGTMVREAAVLDVPAASFFGGPLGGVDARLADLGRLTLLRSESDVDHLSLPRRGRLHGNPRSAPLPDTGALRDFLYTRVRRHLRGSSASESKASERS